MRNQAATTAREEWKEKMEAFKNAGGVVPKREPRGTRVAWTPDFLSGRDVCFRGGFEI